MWTSCPRPAPPPHFARPDGQPFRLTTGNGFAHIPTVPTTINIKIIKTTRSIGVICHFQRSLHHTGRPNRTGEPETVFGGMCRYRLPSVDGRGGRSRAGKPCCRQLRIPPRGCRPTHKNRTRVNAQKTKIENAAKESFLDQHSPF